MESPDETPTTDITTALATPIWNSPWDDRVRAYEESGYLLHRADLPTDPKTGLLRMFYSDLPDELNPRKRPQEETVLPVPPVMLQGRIIKDANHFDHAGQHLKLVRLKLRFVADHANDRAIRTPAQMRREPQRLDPLDHMVDLRLGASRFENDDHECLPVGGLWFASYQVRETTSACAKSRI